MPTRREREYYRMGFQDGLRDARRDIGRDLGPEYRGYGNPELDVLSPVRRNQSVNYQHGISMLRISATT